MGFLSALFAVVGFISGLISIYTFITSGPHTPTRRTSIIFGIVGVGILLLAFLVANLPPTSGGSGRNSTPQPSSNSPPETSAAPTQAQPTPPPPPPAPGTILCQSNWSGGLNGWVGSDDWKVFDGKLLNDGTRNYAGAEVAPTILAPCQLDGLADYAVEVKIHVTRGYLCFGIDARGVSTANGWKGYEASMCNGNAFISTEDSTNISKAPFDLGNAARTYRFEAKGTKLRLLVDGATILGTTDSRYLSGAQVGLWCHLTQLEVSSFKVIAL